MEKITSFIKRFTDKKLSEHDEIVKIGYKYFLADQELVKLQKQIPEEAESIGIFLGRPNKAKKEFQPSPALLEMLAKLSDKKLFINKEAEWLFLCGRDVFSQNSVKSNIPEGIVLVQNEDDENLGMGKLEKGKKGLFLNPCRRPVHLLFRLPLFHPPPHTHK